MKINAQDCLELLKKSVTQKLAYREDNNYEEWKKQIKEKYDELLGINEIRKNICPFGEKILEEEQLDGYRRIHFTFNSEVGAVVPCYILIPDLGKEKYPVVITLQGHNENGYLRSIGVGKTLEEAEEASAVGNFAVQAVREGYVAIALEQRALGVRRPEDSNRKWAKMCDYEAHVAEMLGRTVVGERAWDVSRLIDLLVEFGECDREKIVVTGESVGGVAAYYAACLDERIKIAIPFNGFCDYKNSIMNYFHCSCNYIPHAYEWFEMQDLACLIAPRKLVCINDENEETISISGVRDAFHTIEKIYDRQNATGNCRLAVIKNGKGWNKDIVWPAVRAEMIKFGWIE